MIRYEANNPGVIKIKEAYSAEVWNSISVLKRGKTVDNIRHVMLEPAPKKEMSEEKKANLIDLYIINILEYYPVTFYYVVYSSFIFVRNIFF